MNDPHHNFAYVFCSFHKYVEDTVGYSIKFSRFLLWEVLYFSKLKKLPGQGCLVWLGGPCTAQRALNKGANGGYKPVWTLLAKL